MAASTSKLWPDADLRRQSARTGGYLFACNPELSAALAPAIWRPELLPSGVVLIATPRSYRRTRTIAAADIPPAILDRRSVDGRHLVLSDPAGNHYLRLPEPDAGLPLAALIPLDRETPVRIAALLRVYRHLIGRPSGPLPQAWQLTPRRRRRLVLMVRALDGHLIKASYREIAEVLHGLEAVTRYPWKTSSVRGQTIRLVRDAVIAMNGGYRNLLRGDR